MALDEADVLTEPEERRSRRRWWLIGGVAAAALALAGMYVFVLTLVDDRSGLTTVGTFGAPANFGSTSSSRSTRSTSRGTT